ncbi:MAG: IclR family transcriptional regulator [Pseudomonadota bacterium]
MSSTTEVQTEPQTAKVDSTLAKGLSVLDALAGAPDGRGVTELSRELGLSKSNTFRLLKSLTVLGYVRPGPDKSYRATMKVWQVGQKVLNNLNLSDLARKEMRKLSEETGEAIYLAVPEGLSIIYIDKIDATQPISSFTPKGGSAPIHCVGTGKALLAASYETLRDRVKDHLVKFTDETITDIEKLDADIQLTVARGYAIDRGEYRRRIFSFGAAIYSPDGQPIAAIGVSAPDVNLTGDRAEEICALVAAAANAVTDAIAQT